MEDRLLPSGERWTRVPKPQINFQVASSLRPYLLNEVERLSPECQRSTTGGNGHPGLAADKVLRWEKLPLAEALCLITEESVGQRFWRIRQTLSANKRKLKGTIYSTSHTTWFHHGWVWLQRNPDLGDLLF